MSTYDFDLFTIGAGSGGVAGSRRAASYGARVAICESRRVGGTCVLRGCVPKKLLVYGSHFADEIEDARGFGWTIGEHHVDWENLIKPPNAELDRLNGIYIRMLRDAGAKLIEGFAKIVDPHTVEVNGQRYSAKHILVATGSRPVRPAIPGGELGISSDEALDLPYVPKRVLVVGGGYIAVEFAGIWRGVGAEVTIAVRGDSVLRGFDDDVRESVTENLGKRGIRIFRETVVRSIERCANGLSVRLGGGEMLETDVVLFATGRLPNSENLGLENVGVRVDSVGAIEVNSFSQTNVPSIYAVGDVTNRINLTPVAIAEARALAAEAHSAALDKLFSLVPGTLVVYEQGAGPGPFLPTGIGGAGVSAMFGYSDEEALADPHFFTKNIHPEDAPRVMNEVMAFLEKGESHLSPHRMQRKDGEYVWVEAHFMYAREPNGPGKLHAVMFDVTERVKKEQEQLATLASEQKLRRRLDGFVSSVPGIVWESYFVPARDEARVDFVSDSVYAVTGYTVEE